MVYFDIERIEYFLNQENQFIKELVQLMIKNVLINKDPNSIEWHTLYKSKIIVDLNLDGMSDMICDEKDIEYYKPNVE